MAEEQWTAAPHAVAGHAYVAGHPDDPWNELSDRLYTVASAGYGGWDSAQPDAVAFRRAAAVRSAH